MTQEDKELLLKDPCARLLYKVKCCIYNFGEDTVRIKEDILWSVRGDNILTLKSCVENREAYMYHQIKPYLFPLSNMTDGQKSQLNFCLTRIKFAYDASLIIDWLNKNHFDYRGLIGRGLAIDATNLNIY